MKAAFFLALAVSFPLSAQEPRAHRLDANPILRPEMIPNDDGQWSGDLNFPSVIRAPDWLPNRLGNYYLYFSAHHGTYVRLAYSDRIEGPWKIHEPGTLRLEQVEAINGVTEKIDGRHVASPDVHVDADRKQIRMYFHYLLPKLGHKASLAFSTDGLKFEPRAGAIAGPYLRVFQINAAYWALDDRGVISKSPDGIKPFTPLNESVKRAATDAANKITFRHGAVLVNGRTLWLFYSRIGDAPERIFYVRLQMDGDPATWTPTPPRELLRPEKPWEGAAFENLPSTFRGQTNVNQLRDPFPFLDAGKTFLFYATAGESGIAIAELSPAP